MEAKEDHAKENEERLLTEFAVAREPCVLQRLKGKQGTGEQREASGVL